MYRCPECHASNVKITREIVIFEYWNGDDIVDTEECIDERAPEFAMIECMECGYEDPQIGSLDEWWSEN